VNTADRLGRYGVSADRSQAKDSDLARRATGPVALVTRVEVGSRGPCRRAGIAGEQLGSVLRGRSHELDRAFGMREQVGALGRMLRAPVIGPDREQPIGVLDQRQRMRALQPGLRTRRRDQPHLADSDRAQPAAGRRNQHLVDPRRQVEQELITGPGHRRALDQHLMDAQASTAKRAFPPKGRGTTVLTLELRHMGIPQTISVLLGITERNLKLL